MKLCKPFKSATPSSLTQGFSESHQANDFASFFGDWLVAPFNAKVTIIRGVQNPEDIKDGDNSYLEGGCGIRLQSIEDPSITFAYWHCQDVFPVEVGQTVLMGQPVAMEGNTGFVMSGGQIVPIDQRFVPPYRGTHTHVSMGRTAPDGTYTAMDYSKYIDWDIPIKFDLLTTIKNLLTKIINLLKKS